MTTTELKMQFKALLGEAASLPYNEAISLLSTLQGYTEARIELLPTPTTRQYNRKEKTEGE